MAKYWRICRSARLSMLSNSLTVRPFATTGDSQLSVAAETAAGKIRYCADRKKREREPRTMALDPGCRRIFLPGADL